MQEKEENQIEKGKLGLLSSLMLRKCPFLTAKMQFVHLGCE